MVPSASCCFLHVFTSQEINTKRSPNATKHFEDFFGPEDIHCAKKARGGAPRGAAPTRACLGAQARLGGLCPPRMPPEPSLCSINTPIFHKPYGSRRKSIPPAAKSRTTRSNLDTITEGFTTSIGASLMMRE